MGSGSAACARGDSVGNFFTHAQLWMEGRPRIWNLLGLIPVIVGTTCLLWIMVLHLGRTPERVELEWTPKYLLRRGPYVVVTNLFPPEISTS